MMWRFGDADLGGAMFWIVSFLSAGLGLAITIGLIVLLVLGIRWLVRADRSSRLPPQPPAPGWGAPGTPQGDPLEILRQRYARGEIDDEEFERRRKTLTGG